MMGSDDQKRMLIAMASAMVILLLAQIFIYGPQASQRKQALEAQAAAAAASAPAASTAAPGAAATPAARPVPGTTPEAVSVAASPRIPIETPALDGSIALVGARFDTLFMKRYTNTLKKDSGEVQLLYPANSPEGHYAFFGWIPAEGTAAATPAPDTPWTLVEGTTLTPSSPIKLTWTNPDGVRFDRVISVDENYMFAVADTVTNGAAAAVTLKPYAAMRRNAIPKSASAAHVWHEGPLGVTDAKYFDVTYKKIQDGEAVRKSASSGWFGITDKYWLTAFIPQAGSAFDGAISNADDNAGGRHFRVDVEGAARAVAPGQAVTVETRFFAGAKRVDLLRAYQNDPAKPIVRFDDAVDWGMFWFLTRPFFWLFSHAGDLLKNWGLAILAVTVIVKLALFPVNQKAYESMTKMRVVAPKMTELQAKYKDDRAKLQQEMMLLYQSEKLNPFAGCLPILAQIPIFFALYKTLSIAIELRHAPFFGWIQDLSAPDPTTIFNLFGLLPIDTSNWPAFLIIGVWPLLYSITMAAVQNLSPPPPDPTTAMVFKWMPWIFLFIFAGFPAGLVIYWAWSNVLTFAQQYVIMRKYGVETELDKFLKKRFGKAEAPAG
jgi:YidC/Oxa1 family membrane protein insertase